MALERIFKPKFAYKLIRLGRKNDGGYLLGMNTINKTNTLISFGINDDWSFEKKFYDLNNKIKILAFDDQLNFFFLIKKIFSNFIKFFIPGYKSFLLNSILNTVNYLYFFRFFFIRKRIAPGDVMIISEGYSNIFFKIDIEGSEYKILEELIKIKKKIVGIVIEFHHPDKKIKEIKKFIKKIDLKITHIHANNYWGINKKKNPNLLEITFEKKPKILNKNLNFPHLLDMPNNPKKKEIDIKFI